MSNVSRPNFSRQEAMNRLRRSKERRARFNSFRTVPRRKSILNQADIRGVEKKNRDALATYSLPITGTFSDPVLISGVAVGTDPLTRVGRKVTMKSINMRYALVCTAIATGAGGPVPNRTRILLVYDKSPNGVLPSSADILEPGAGFNAMMDLNNSDRFVIIADEMSEQTQGGAALALAGAALSSGSVYRKINMESLYGGNSAAIGDIRSGAIYIMAASDTVMSATQATYGVNALTRIRYTDV